VRTVVVPYHLDERLDPFDVDVDGDVQVVTGMPDAGRWQRLAALYEQLAEVVSGNAAPPLVVSGDCTTSLGVLAGLQRAGRDVGVVWFDAHADFHTEASSTSGYIGGMCLALAAGVGTLTLPTALGLRPMPADRIVLVDARDTDPPEQDLLAAAHVQRLPLTELTPERLPPGVLYLHLDIDVVDPRDVPGLRYPAADGPRLQQVLHALRVVKATGRVVAAGFAATWHPDTSDPTHRDIAQQVLEVLEQHS
jgi:arginase